MLSYSPVCKHVCVNIYVFRCVGMTCVRVCTCVWMCVHVQVSECSLSPQANRDSWDFEDSWLTESPSVVEETSLNRMLPNLHQYKAMVSHYIKPEHRQVFAYSSLAVIGTWDQTLTY